MEHTNILSLDKEKKEPQQFLPHLLTFIKIYAKYIVHWKFEIETTGVGLINFSFLKFC